jgi:hypothetical protein
LIKQALLVLLGDVDSALRRNFTESKPTRIFYESEAFLGLALFPREMASQFVNLAAGGLAGGR